MDTGIGRAADGGKGAARHDLEECIRNCGRCHAVCVQSAAYCFERGGKLCQPEHLNTLLICADICEVSADAMLRGSALHTTLCGACAEICACCATSCEAVSEDHPLLRECARICMRCFDTCSAMAAEAV